MFFAAFLLPRRVPTRKFDAIPASQTHRIRRDPCLSRRRIKSPRSLIDFFATVLLNRNESVSPRTSFPAHSSIETIQRFQAWTFPCAFIFLERKMPNQFVAKATRSPLSFLLVCIGLYFAAHSFFAALLVGYIVLTWIRKSIRDAHRNDAETTDVKAPPAGVTPPQKAEAGATATVTPIKRQYAKSPVVAPLKTGTDDTSAGL
jgi:hypothetical protein